MGEMADLKGLGRFTDPAVLILSSLAGGDKHGWALIKDIEGFADVVLGPGTLYGALTRLEERGLVKALPAQERRRPYRLTAAGARALHAYLSHARMVTETGLSRLAQA
jgi:DNA-binding PadR family transcriptional regulator